MCIGRRKYRLLVLCLAIVLVFTVLCYKYLQRGGKYKIQNRANTDTNHTSLVKVSVASTNSVSITPEEDILWTGCPGLDEVLVTVKPRQGELGQTVQEYLSTWALAKVYKLWPVIPKKSLDILSTVFQNLSISTIEEISNNCPGFSQLGHIFKKSSPISHKKLLKTLDERPAVGKKPLLLNVKVNSAKQEIIYLSSQLRTQMRFKHDLVETANKVFENVYEYVYSITGLLQAVELVGVHVRRTDYLQVLTDLYPVVDERYYLNAMAWMRNRLQPTAVIFVVVSDDIPWCLKHFQLPDVAIAGSGLESSGLDFAILSLCNHTIFSYGSFGLSAAILAQGQYTLVLNTENGTQNDEMKYAPYLSGWNILNNMGQEKTFSKLSN